MSARHPVPLLLVVDLQNGFVNAHTRHVLPVVSRLLAGWRAVSAPVAFTRFVNVSGGPFFRWLGWRRFTAEPENALAPGLGERAGEVFVKHGYSAFTPAFTEHVERLGVRAVTVCGIATDGCVLKSVVDAFERGIEPVVVTDACASHAGPELHRAGLTLLARFIGDGQLRDAGAVLGALAPGPAPVAAAGTGGATDSSMRTGPGGSGPPAD